MKDFIKNILLVSIPSLIFLFILLEIILAFLMPLPSRPETIYDSHNNILKFSPESGNGTYTKGKFFQIRADWSINNQGWNYPSDYESPPEKELIAVIGDSYVEALQVDSDENFSWLLQNQMGDSVSVYAFGKSLYPLSQYLHISRYVTQKYNPSILIFSVVHNDFKESIEGKGNDQRFQALMQLEINSNGTVTERKPYYHEYLQKRLNPGLFRSIVLKSRVQRYIRYPDFLNIQPSNMLQNIGRSPDDPNQSDNRFFEDNIDVKSVSQSEEEIKLAVHYVIKKIREENPNRRIIFMLDAPRSVIYSGNSYKNSGNYWLHELMHEATKLNGIEFIDLGPLMEEDFKKNQHKFNSEVDSHWNEYGHQFVANILYTHLQN